jgi:hypothetical protein
MHKERKRERERYACIENRKEGSRIAKGKGEGNTHAYT